MTNRSETPRSPSAGRIPVDMRLVSPCGCLRSPECGCPERLVTSPTPVELPPPGLVSGAPVTRARSSELAETFARSRAARRGTVIHSAFDPRATTIGQTADVAHDPRRPPEEVVRRLEQFLASHPALSANLRRLRAAVAPPVARPAVSPPSHTPTPTTPGALLAAAAAAVTAAAAAADSLVDLPTGTGGVFDPTLLAVVNLDIAHTDTDTATGTDDSILSDLQLLGAGVARQLGNRDLLWEVLAADPSSTSKKAVPVPVLEEIPALIMADANVADQAEFLTTAFTHGVRPHYMFFGAGGGFQGRKNLTYNGREVREAAPLTWNVPSSKRFAFNKPVREAIADDPGLADALYIENAYDQEAVSYMAWATAALLWMGWKRALAEDPRAFNGAELADIVHAVECSNELQTVYQILNEAGNPDAAASGKAWGRIFYNFTVAFKTFFDAVGDRCPAMWMAGLLSYGDVVAEGSAAAARSYGQDWFRALCREVVHTNELLPSGFEAAELFDGVDYHWYHMQGTEGHPAAPVPVWLMPAELQAIRTSLSGAGLTRASVSIFENGMRGDNLSATADFLPNGYTADVDGWNRFQAHEVWRRLLGACAAGASVQGIHTLMASYGGAEEDSVNPYHDFGLRVDSVPEDDPETEVSSQNVTKVAQALQRPAWYAYQRLSGLYSFGDSLRTVTRAPVSTSVEGLAAMIDTPARVDASEDVLIFELEWGGGDYRHGYVIMMDPWRNTADHFVSWSSTHSDVTVIELPFEPSGFMKVTVAEPAKTLRLSRALYDPPSAGPRPGAALRVRSAASPRILLAAEPLVWAVSASNDVQADGPGVVAHQAPR